MERSRSRSDPFQKARLRLDYHKPTTIFGTKERERDALGKRGFPRMSAEEHHLLVILFPSPTTMTKATSSSTDASLPLPKHALTLNYIRLRAIATLVQVPIGFIITLCHYFLHPSFLRKYEVTRSRFHVPSRQKGRTIKVDIFTPKSGVKKPYPVHINWHGSGFGESVL
jgi:hypothetical protein